MNKQGQFYPILVTIFVGGILLMFLILIVAPINNVTADAAVNTVGLTGIDAFGFSNLNMGWLFMTILLILGGLAASRNQ